MISRANGKELCFKTDLGNEIKWAYNQVNLGDELKWSYN